MAKLYAFVTYIQPVTHKSITERISGESTCELNVNANRAAGDAKTINVEYRPDAHPNFIGVEEA